MFEGPGLPPLGHFHSHVLRSMQALSAYQAGLLLILSFPYLPDMIALVRELASSLNAPSSEELLTKGAMRYAEKQGAADIQVFPCTLLPLQILTFILCFVQPFAGSARWSCRKLIGWLAVV